ncbi:MULTISPECIES: hypothetical protein [unclassified Thiocapsa]|uniref:hypothetical protein n=1 Tax=unclassified Thiocapsa TaxID=2641286 RepID=UPI0035B17901
MSAETLLDIFVPPEGMVGYSAALVAMTGADDFLEDAVQRFTGLRPRQRAALGDVLVYLMLDGHASSSRQGVFPPGRIPGLHEFQPRAVAPGSLLHAKVALLAFAPSREGAPVHLRLAVLTANYTYTSARQQLELVWVVDLPLVGSARVEDRADVAAAAAFVETLLARRFHRDEQPLPVKEHKLTARLDVLLAAASSLDPANRKPRFIHAGYLRDGHVSNGWLYLGSGNLSRRGILTHGRMADGNVETGVVFAVDERLDGEAIERWLFWSDEAETVGDEEWAIGQVGDAPDTQPIMEAPPILSATIETSPSQHLRLLWRDDVSTELRVSISWTGRDWFDVKRGDGVPLQNDESPTALNVAGESAHRWVVPIVDAAGRVGWQPPRFDTYADALAALLDFPIRPAEATDDDDSDEEDGRDKSREKRPGERKGERSELEKTYALDAAAELIEKVAALQGALPESMLDDWLGHLDRMFHASFPQALIETWRTHRLNIFLHLKAEELRPPNLNEQQKARYSEVLDGAARAWGLR